MVIVIVALCLACGWWMLRPIFGAAQQLHTAHALEQYRNFQAFAVLKYHPAFQTDRELRALSIEDLRRDYNLTDLNNELGCPSRR